MIIYSVSITVAGSIEEEWLLWMTTAHVPDVLRTGCFLECRICKVLDEGPEEATYLLQYQCASMEEYQRYRDNFASALQKDHLDRFAGSFRATRQLLEEVTTVRASE